MKTAVNALVSTILAVTICLAVARCAAQADDPQARGVALIQEVARAYQEAPALVDDFQVTMKGLRGELTELRTVRLGAGTDAQVTIQGYEITAIGGEFIVQHTDRANKYLQQPLNVNLIESFAGLSGGNMLPVPQCILRYATTMEQYLQSFGLSRASDLSITGVDIVERDGKRFEQLMFDNPQGITVKALIDPKTKFIAAIDITAPGVEITATMAPKRLDRLPELPAVSPVNRRKVDTLQELMVLVAGDDAPDFKLETLDGAEVSLAAHRGSVVVIDFWATWCGPCRLGLPKLQEFANWARNEGLAVTVLPVNMGERHPTREAKKIAVASFWKRQGFTMPTLLDYDNTTARAFQVGNIPHTVIVDPQGKIMKVEIGFNRNAVDHYKKLARQALGG